MARKGSGLSVPWALEHVWNAFCALAGTRPNNGFGLLPITFAEIAAWDGLTGARLSPWEASLIHRVDAAVLPILNRKKGTEDPEVEVAADDEVGVKSIFANLRARSQAAFRKPAANS